MNDPALLALAARLAADAGAVILDIRARGFAVQQKDDNTLVTAADHAAEAVILAGLRQATPDLGVIAEEDVAAGNIARIGDSYWLVDPLDGTREFAAGHDEFVVNIGLVRDGVAVLGAVYIPATGEMFGGILGQGAWKQDQAGRRAIAARAEPADGLVVLASRSHNNNAKLDAYLAGRRVARVANYGSAVKFCRIAEGVADLYPRFGRTMEWDTAAPQALLEAAGGHVRCLDGARLLYGKPGCENPGFVCSGQDA
ncbi:MAG: 3'(2'),5'-bisphosphate nucleotidase CysQ [Rhodospirillales bacterium]|nr:3'(2'),5'-bisphosphate nucleotidase CysQ [Rhodospirillales bacterium]